MDKPGWKGSDEEDDEACSETVDGALDVLGVRIGTETEGLGLCGALLAGMVSVSGVRFEPGRELANMSDWVPRESVESNVRCSKSSPLSEDPVLNTSSSELGVIALWEDDEAEEADSPGVVDAGVMILVMIKNVQIRRC